MEEPNITVRIYENHACSSCGQTRTCYDLTDKVICGKCWELETIAWNWRFHSAMNSLNLIPETQSLAQKSAARFRELCPNWQAWSQMEPELAAIIRKAIEESNSGTLSTLKTVEMVNTHLVATIEYAKREFESNGIRTGMLDTALSIAKRNPHETAPS